MFYCFSNIELNFEKCQLLNNFFNFTFEPFVGPLVLVLKLANDIIYLKSYFGY